MATWRPAAFTREQRLAMAARVLQRLQERHGADLLALAVEGSTAKGTDSPLSDLDCRAVLRLATEDRWYAAFTGGMFVGVSVVSAEQALADAQTVEHTWPVVGDAVWTARVLYDPTDLYTRLRAAAAAAEASADFRALARAAMADMYEHVYKLFAPGAGEGGKDAFVEATAAWSAAQVAFWAADAVGLVNRRRYLSSRTMLAESASLPSLPRGYGAHLQRLMAPGATADGRAEEAAALWAAFLPWAAERGIRLDDDDLSGL